MSVVSCKTSNCPDSVNCSALGVCAMADLPVVMTAGPVDASADEKLEKPIDEYSLDDYRRGVEKLMSRRTYLP